MLCRIDIIYCAIFIKFKEKKNNSEQLNNKQCQLTFILLVLCDSFCPLRVFSNIVMARMVKNGLRLHNIYCIRC